MNIKLDIIDKKIIHELDINSRQPNSKIAKTLGISKQVVGFRIQKLLKEKVISFFYPIVDISKLGFTVHKNFLRLQNIDRKKEEQLIKFLINHPNVVWVASCDGKFDLAFGTWAKDVIFLDKTITELNLKFSKYLSERQVATIIKGEYFIRDYLVSKSLINSNRESFFGAIPSPVNIDKNDWAILFSLSINSRISDVDLSKKINLSADAIAKRIRKLEKIGVIRHYNIVPNESVYPYLHYKVLIGLKSSSQDNEKTIRNYCKNNLNIVYLVKSFGPWEFELDLEVESVEKFREIMMDIKNKFSEFLKDYSVLDIYKVHKYNFCPSIH